MKSRDWRRRALRRDVLTACIGLGVVAACLGFTQTRPFYSLVKAGHAGKVTKANISGSTEVFLVDGVLTDEQSKAPVAAVVRWKASRQAMGKPGSPLWEGGAVEITTVQVKAPLITEGQVRAFVEERGLGPALPNFVGGREVPGSAMRIMFPTPATEVHHVDRALATFRESWPRGFWLAVGGLGAVALGSVLFPRTVRAFIRDRRGRCARCGYELAELGACPECGVERDEAGTLPA